MLFVSSVGWWISKKQTALRLCRMSHCNRTYEIVVGSVQNPYACELVLSGVCNAKLAVDLFSGYPDGGNTKPRTPFIPFTNTSFLCGSNVHNTLHMKLLRVYKYYI